MSEPLVDEGWLAPTRPGPSRRVAVVLVLVALLGFGAWFLATMTWRSGSGAGDRQVTVLELNEFGRAAIGGTTRELPVEVRTSRGVDYVVVRHRIENRASGTQRVSVRLPAGVDPERATLRVVGSLDDVRIRHNELGVPRADVTAGGPTDDLRVALVVPAELVTLPADRQQSAGALRDVTRPLDLAARRETSQLETLERLRSNVPWLLLFVLGAGVAAPLLLWRAARRSFFSMRRPGAGKEFDSAPPSSLDPVGAAVLVAGARPVDAVAAFAGHVLDLVERRQLVMRRTMDVDPGAGALIGIGRVEEDSHDPAVRALRSIALDDGITVAVPDSPGKRRRVPEHERDDWHLHVAARERFEGMVDRVDGRRQRIATIVLGAITIASIVGGIATDLPARRATLGLVAVLVAPAAISTALWMLDARRWRIVTRARRLERAQWLAWRSVVGTTGGPALDQRNIPVIAATGAAASGIRTFAGPDAVGMAAVTTKTIEGLKAMISDE